ncbi:MAG: YbdK family carboxylate-amine ligase [Gaiellaceae bacterium]
MIESHFGESSAWSVGVEEELFIVDDETLELAPGVETLIAETDGELPGLLKPELFASFVELNTKVCGSVHEALEALATLRRRASEVARRNGLALAASGSHPFSRPEEQQVLPEERYLNFVAYAGVSARRQAVCGLHVHVGMPSAEACQQALEGVLPWLPVVLALSANSPYFAGEETGLASTRAEVLAQLPRSGGPPAFSSYREWEEFVERFVHVGLAEDHTRFWWDVRPHPTFGTLEVRMPDQPTSLPLTGAFAALVQALCVTALKEPVRPPSPRGDYAQNRWAALRFGPRAQLIHPDGDRLLGVPELADELLERARPALRELGSEQLVTVLEPARCEGDRQLEVGRERGLGPVVADAVERTLGSD